MITVALDHSAKSGSALNFFMLAEVNVTGLTVTEVRGYGLLQVRFAGSATLLAAGQEGTDEC